MNLEIAKQCIEYVIIAPFFWGTMGFTTAFGMYVGAILYNGNLGQASKGVFGIFTYAGMLLWITSSRVFNSITEDTKFPLAFAGLITIVITTVFWVLGVFIGVSLLNLRKHDRSPFAY